ncbi:MAG: hypothetical protein JJT94_17085 [Bernardetiaceae bacterium]|nr:hypothetical protein [Bernardetiaceae bacterium]
MFNSIKILSFALVFALSALFACGGSGESENNKEEQPSDSLATEQILEDTDPQDANEPEVPQSNEQKIAGTFVEIEQGDYFYFVINDEAGERQSFMIFQGDETFDTIDENPSAYVGKKMAVYYEITTQEIPEAGGEIEIQKYLRAELMD